MTDAPFLGQRVCFLGPSFLVFQRYGNLGWVRVATNGDIIQMYIYIYTITSCLRILLALLLDTVNSNPSVYAIITSTWVYKTHEISGDQTWQ